MHNDERKMMPGVRGRRQSSRGQVVVLVALMSVVLIGATALAVDLSLNTNQQRALQNVADSAALAGATDVGGDGFSAGLAEEAAANTDALITAGDNLGFPANWQGDPGNTCPAANGGIGYCTSVPYQNYRFSVSTPPQNPKDPNYGKENYVEVDISENGTNQFAAVIGQSASTVRAHAIAFHWGPTGSFGYALYANNWVATGNQATTVNGDVFIGGWWAPQSQGKSSLCAGYINGNQKGHVVFGLPQPPTAPQPPHASFPQMLPAQYGITCPGANNGLVYAQHPAGPGPGSCPPGVDWNTSDTMCESSPGVPAFPEPTTNANVNVYTPTGVFAACSTLNNLAKVSKGGVEGGVWEVPHSSCGGPGYDLTIDFGNGNNFATDPAGDSVIPCVSLILDPGAQVYIYSKFKPSPPANVITSYGSGATSFSTCPVLPASTANVDRTVIWSSANDTGSSAPNIQMDGNGCCPEFRFVGSIYSPTGGFHSTQNAAFDNVGEAIVGVWDDQSGNHPDPTVTDNPNLTPVLPEVLRLVE